MSDRLSSETCAPCVPPEIEGAPKLDWLPAPFSMAFQPIVDVLSRKIIGHEALVRGPRGEPAAAVLGTTPSDHATNLDYLAREKAIRLCATRPDGLLFLNASALAAVDEANGLVASIRRAERIGVDPARLVFEITEGEQFDDIEALARAAESCREAGARVALDDFGSGWSSLQRLLGVRPDVMKLDRQFVAGVDRCAEQQALVRSMARLCKDLGIVFVVEGVETAGESIWLRKVGASIQQGFGLAKPAFEMFRARSEVSWF